MLFWTVLSALASDPSGVPLAVNRKWEVLKEGDERQKLAKAAELLGDWEIDLAGVAVDGARLAPFGVPSDEPLVRQVREGLGRPVDLGDFLYFLDDVLAAEDRRGERFHVHSGRARGAGILLHPDDVFKNKPRVYGAKDTLPVDVPKPQPDVENAAPDGAPPGPDWTARYRNPEDRAAMMAMLRRERPEADFADRIESLLAELESAGAEVYLASASRYRERGYLMWGAFVLSKAKSKAEVDQLVAKLDDRNAKWGLDIPIAWRHPDGWEATVEAARQMADTYDVVYATENGAKSSNHYGGTAVDLVAIALPRRVTLTAPDGACRSFLLTDPDESRDLSLTPRMIDWIEAHWGLSKLRSDYPHWDDSQK
ncbi:MAG: hypothetical protein H6737_28500 [Alphaproteobacteria bacterium]|nr:hypothetical protein [Alphaproteobacteria bacterium]